MIGMIRSYRRAMLLFLAVMLAGCGTSGGKQSETASNKPKIVATTSVLCDLTRQLAQDSVDLTCLLEAGQDPHTYKPTPRDRKALEAADLILYSGYNFAPKLIQLVEATRSSSPKIAVYEKAVTSPIFAAAHNHEHEQDETEAVNHHNEHEHEEEAHHNEHKHEEEAHHDEHEHEEEAHHDEHKDEDSHDRHEEDEDLVADPHIWHDAEHGIQIVNIIDKQLQQIAPDNAERYRQNAATLTAELKTLDTWIQAQVETVPAADRTLVTTHDAFRYYASAYGFSVAGALSGLSTEEKPSAGQMSELIELVETANVPAIFAESTTNRQLIETVARDAGVKVAEQSLLVEGPGSADETYQAMMVTNTCTIVVALGGSCSP